MTRSRILVWLALVALLGGACGSATAQPRGDAAAIAPDLAEEVGDEAVGDLAHGLDTLGWDLLTQLRHGSATTVVSPVSVAAMLSLVLAGAGGETAEELADALGTDPAAPGDGRVGALLLRLTSTDEVELTLANAVWVADAHALTDSYHDDVTRTLGATVDELDLADPAAVAVIDEWVADRTDGLIDRITDALRVPDPNVVAVLANATHFAGSWSDAFDPDDTAPGTFTRDDGSEVQVPLMRHDRTAVDVAVDPGAQLLLARLPYGDSDDDRGDFGFEVLVPTDARPLAEALDAIDAETWAG